MYFLAHREIEQIHHRFQRVIPGDGVLERVPDSIGAYRRI
jgi:hypothetical protein